MQPMARPGIKHYPDAAPISARTGFRVLMAIDLVQHVLIAIGAIWRVFAVGDLFAWVALGLSVGIAFTSLGCMGLRPLSTVWRRRLGAIAVLAVLLRNGPFAHLPWVAASVTLWNGTIWVALLLEGRRIAAAVVEATGEEGLGEDPSRHL